MHICLIPWPWIGCHYLWNKRTKAQLNHKYAGESSDHFVEQFEDGRRKLRELVLDQKQVSVSFTNLPCRRPSIDDWRSVEGTRPLHKDRYHHPTTCMFTIEFIVLHTFGVIFVACMFLLLCPSISSSLRLLLPWISILCIFKKQTTWGIGPFVQSSCLFLVCFFFNGKEWLRFEWV